MANAKKSISGVPVLDSNGNKIGTINLVFPVHTVLPDFEELDSTDDFADPDTYNYGSEHEPDVLDVLIAREENPEDYEEKKDEESVSSVVALGHLLRMLVRLHKDTHPAFNDEIEDEENGIVFPYDSIAEPPVRAKLEVRAREGADGWHRSWKTMYKEVNNCHRQCGFTKRHYATVRGAVAIGENVYAISKQR